MSLYLFNISIISFQILNALSILRRDLPALSTTAKDCNKNEIRKEQGILFTSFKDGLCESYCFNCYRDRDGGCSYRVD